MRGYEVVRCIELLRAHEKGRQHWRIQRIDAYASSRPFSGDRRLLRKRNRDGGSVRESGTKDELGLVHAASKQEGERDSDRPQGIACSSGTRDARG